MENGKGRNSIRYDRKHFFLKNRSTKVRCLSVDFGAKRLETLLIKLEKIIENQLHICFILKLFIIPE